MDRQRKRNGQVEINDLVSVAVSNAVARRNQVDLEELSEQQAEAVKGGLVSQSVKPAICQPPIIVGLLPMPPVLTV